MGSSEEAFYLIWTQIISSVNAVNHRQNLRVHVLKPHGLLVFLVVGFTTAGFAGSVHPPEEFARRA